MRNFSPPTCGTARSHSPSRATPKTAAPPRSPPRRPPRPTAQCDSMSRAGQSALAAPRTRLQQRAASDKRQDSGMRPAHRPAYWADVCRKKCTAEAVRFPGRRDSWRIATSARGVRARFPQTDQSRRRQLRETCGSTPSVSSRPPRKKLRLIAGNANEPQSITLGMTLFMSHPIRLCRETQITSARCSRLARGLAD